MKHIGRLFAKYSTVGSCILLALAIGAAVRQFLKLYISDWITLMLVIGCGILLEAIDRCKRKVFLYIGGAAVFGGIAISAILSKFKTAQAVRKLAQWLAGYNGSQEAFKIKEGMVVLAVLCLAAVIVSFFVHRLGRKQFYFDIGLAALGIASVFAGWQLPRAGGMGLLAYGLSELTRAAYIRGGWKKEQKRARITTAYLMPLFLGMALVVGVIPYKETPIKWERLKAVYASFSRQVQQWWYEADIRLNNRGDQLANGLFYDLDGQRISGNVKPGSSKWMKVHILTKTHEPLYMAASYKDTYQDNRWTAADDYKLLIEDYKLDSYEIIYALLRQRGLKNWRSLMRLKTMEVEYDKLTTGALFTPARTINIDAGKKELCYTNNGIHFSKTQSSQTVYHSSFIELNPTSPRLITMLRSADGFDYNNRLPMTLGRFKTRGKDQVSSLMKDCDEDDSLDLNKLLEERAEHIKKDYTKLPAGFSMRVQSLAKELTRSCTNNYDKLMVLKEYLGQYSYTLSPGSLPKGKELTDYFLFEGQQGYCTYYATAMVNMGRSLGIPMRYAEGVVLDYEPEDGMTNFCIRSSKAHAWAEAYFEGAGWVIIDATPGYGQKRFIIWPDEKELPKTEDETETTETAATVSSPQLQSDIQVAAEGNNLWQKKTVRAVRQLAVVAAAVLLCWLILTAYSLWRYKRAYERGQIKEKFTLLLIQLMAHLSYEHIQLQENETLLQYEEKAAGLGEVDAMQLHEVLQAYMAFRYGGAQLEKQALIQLRSVYDQLIRSRQKKMGKVKVFLQVIRVKCQIVVQKRPKCKQS